MCYIDLIYQFFFYLLVLVPPFCGSPSEIGHEDAQLSLGEVQTELTYDLWNRTCPCHVVLDKPQLKMAQRLFSVACWSCIVGSGVLGWGRGALWCWERHGLPMSCSDLYQWPWRGWGWVASNSDFKFISVLVLCQVWQ